MMRPFCQLVLLLNAFLTIHLLHFHALAEPAQADEAAATFALQTRPFTAEPGDEPLLVREGEAGPVLNCSVGEQFRERNRFELEWTKVVGDTPNLISRNGRLFAPSGPNGYELMDSVAEDGTYNLRIRSVQFQRDNGRFFCALIDTETRQQTLSEPARVLVLVPPEPPQITAQPTEAIREGDFITVRCESAGGNPPPRFQWYFEDKSKVPESWHHERTEGTRSVSTLQMHVKSEHNGARISCKIWNRAMAEGEQLKVEANPLNVLYAPRVRVVPGFEEINVEEGETLPLVCHADANPQAAQYQWIHVPSGETHANKEWHLPIRRIHAGEFRCTATNSLDSGSARIRVNVLYGPTVRIKADGGIDGKVSPAEGDRLVLDCETEANPKADAVVWTGPGGVRQNGTRLVLDSVNRAHSGNFTCSAWNTLQLSPEKPGHTVPPPVIRTGIAQILVDVRRKPGAALILAKRTVVNVGQPIQLDCSTDGDRGSPPAKFKWAGPATKGVYGKEPEWLKAQLRLPEARLTDNGFYRCAAYNEIGQGEDSSVRIMVVEPARLTRPLAPTKTLTSNALDVQLECEARGFPQPRIHWLKDGQPLPIESSKLWALSERTASTNCAHEEACPKSLLSTLHLTHPIGWADKGNYSCVAENSPTAQPVASSMAVSVIHEPVILNARNSDGMALAAADTGEMARISCLISARPEPKVIWSRDGLEIGNGFEEERRHKVRLNRVPGAIDEFESVLELERVDDRDFGTFVCEAKNGAGGRKSGIEIRLQPKSQPQAPIMAKSLQSGLSWLLIGWRPGFDGGERQVFELEYRPVDPFSGHANAEVEPLQFTFGPSNWTNLAMFEADDSAQPVHYLVHNLTQLRPQSAFWYRVRARNTRGASDWTAIANAITEDPRDSLDIPAPESLLYLLDEQRIVVQSMKRSPAYCLLVYAAAAEDGQWRAIDCFPLADSDGSVPGIAPAERFKVRYCMANDMTKCSGHLKVFVDNISSSNTLWMLAFIVGCVCILSFTILFALLCCRRRYQKATAHRTNGATVKPKKKLKLNGGVIVDSRIDNDHQLGSSMTQSTNIKNTPVNGSQTDSGVFTLGSSSAMAANAVAMNGMGSRRGGNLIGINSGDWNLQQCSPQHLSPHQLEPYDFSNDPFLQEFAAANALGGIVVVENTLHQNSSAESTPSIQQQNNSYTKFFNEFSAAFLGNGGKARNSALASMGRPTDANGGGEHTGNSNEQLIASGDGSETASSSIGNGAAGGHGGGGGGRVMREIIV